MCGIVGLAGARVGSDTLPALRRALNRLEHRGPDDAGMLVWAPGEGPARLLDATGHATPLPHTASGRGGLVLGHRRLAIIDPSPAGHQPMATPDGRYVLVLNGEIYNYLELRQELETRGIVFRSHSDTEVLLQAWAAWGPACLPWLTGMFAFVILDLRERQLVLARDPFGMKPFFYARTADGLAFASEIGVLLEVPRVSRRADPQRLFDYLDLGITDHGDRTMFADVGALPAAHYAVLSLDHPDRLDPVCFWEPDLNARLELSFDAAAGRMRDLFVRSVELHLRADTRVGTLLSGGVDSSAIVMAMREVGGRNLALHTFSYIGDMGAISEEPWIDAVNQAAGAIPAKLTLGPEEWAADFDRLIAAQGEPFGTIAIYAQYRLFQMARDAGVRSVLDGQGGDELLGGYRWMWSARIASLLRHGSLGGAWRQLRGTAPAHFRLGPPLRDTAARAVTMCLPRSFSLLAQRLLRRDVRPWIDRRWARRHELRPIPPWWAGGYGPNVLREALWQGVRERTLPTLLRYEDRNSMAHSVEARLPFLTTELAEFALALPEEYLVAPDASGKAVFRAAMRGLVPDVVLDRRDKVGFSVPIHAWIPELPLLDDLLEAARDLPCIDPAGIAPLLGRAKGSTLHDTMRRQSMREQMKYSFWVWRLAGLSGWVKKYGVEIG